MYCYNHILWYVFLCPVCCNTHIVWYVFLQVFYNLGIEVKRIFSLTRVFSMCLLVPNA